MTAQVKPTIRESRRLQTRERILGAAIAEFKRSGTAAAEVSAIVTAAGVAHGTFYFHFPTKEHVLLELECREEARMAAEFAHFLDGTRELAAALTKIAELVAGLERRFGRALFKEVLALHFLPARRLRRVLYHRRRRDPGRHAHQAGRFGAAWSGGSMTPRARCRTHIPLHEPSTRRSEDGLRLGSASLCC